MDWQEIYIFCLIFAYGIIPIPFLHIILTRYLKYEEASLLKISVFWLSCNFLTLVILGTLTRFLGNIIFFSTDLNVVMICVYSIVLCVLSLTGLRWLLKTKFNDHRLYTATLINLAFFCVTSSIIFELDQWRRYKRRWAGAVFPNASNEVKDKTLTALESGLNIDLPKSTRLIYAHSPKGSFKQPFVLAAKIEILRIDLYEFKTRLANKYPNLLDSFVANIAEDNRIHWQSWGPKRIWKPLSASNFEAATDRPMSIFIDLDNNTAIVYITYSLI